MKRGAKPVEGLTDRQAEVLQCLAEGLCNKQIERRLNLSAGTVKAHLTRAYRKLGVATRLQAVIALKGDHPAV